MTVPAAICLASVCLCLYVAFLTARLSRAPGWGHQRYLALASLSAGWFILGDIVQSTPSAPDALVVFASRWQMAGAAAYVVAWMYFSREALALRRTWREPAWATVSAALVVLCVVPGAVYLDSVQSPLSVPWAHASYRFAEMTPLVLAVYAFFFCALGAVTLRFARALLRGRRDVVWEFIGCAAMFLAAINDMLVTLHLYSNILLIDAGYLVPVAATTMAHSAALVSISRDREATNDKLVTALEAANEAARLKSAFLANVSHELRTPLNAIINIPEGLMQHFHEAVVLRCDRCEAAFEVDTTDDHAAETRVPGALAKTCPKCQAPGPMSRLPVTRLDVDPADLLRHLGTVQRSGKHLLSVVDDILDYTKLDAGRLQITLEWASVATLFADLAQIMSPVASKRGVRLAFTTPTDFSVYADPVRFSQIMLNLISNAVKFSPPGARVEIDAEADDSGATFRVRDFGIGISPENHEVIFEAFRQVDGTHTRAAGGTGLGLALTRRLVALHGGEIAVDSALGKGSTFSVRLPTVRARGSALPCEPRDVAPSTPGGERTGT
jgi:signal transduction histidine kinase